MKTVEAKSKLIEIIKSSKEASELFEELYAQENVTENEAILRSVAVALNHPPAEQPEGCEWTYDEATDYYSTSCGYEYIYVDGTIEENDHYFCVGCGRKIIQKAKEE